MEENVVKFQEKLKNLVALAKKKKNILEIQEINDVFRDMELEPTQMDKVFEYLEANGIDVLQMNDDSNVDDDDLEIMLSDEDEVDMEKIDLSVPDGISIEDPVRMYLKEIGTVPLHRDLFSTGNTELYRFHSQLSECCLREGCPDALIY